MISLWEARLTPEQQTQEHAALLHILTTNQDLYPEDGQEAFLGNLTREMFFHTRARFAHSRSWLLSSLRKLGYTPTRHRNRIMWHKQP